MMQSSVVIVRQIFRVLRFMFVCQNSRVTCRATYIDLPYYDLIYKVLLHQGFRVLLNFKPLRCHHLRCQVELIFRFTLTGEKRHLWGRRLLNAMYVPVLGVF